ncbi:MFS transporter [Echinimonas agarilytica]|uniref:MFS transporter n=1 Tax=Echinimonas agarilytica TaxID=1215918 RepID=A0AA41W9G2_9GAMM|nr:MFS transporter [Echinimonas agarilytica]MCM2681181.1 MFS transporter [Echinimonas agarilytica]
MALTEKLKLSEKIGYGLGDAAFNFVWMTFIYFQIFFYTDVFGISAAAIGTMLLVTRVWDTVNDPIMGMLADRTNTRWGKFRPYLLFGAIPLGIAATLAFTTPNMSPENRLIYAYVTYFLVGMVYTALNIPYSSMMSVMTNDPKERASLSSWRFVGAYGAGILVLHFTFDLVERFGQGDQALGFQRTMALYGCVLAAMLMVTFATTKERIKPVNSGHKSFWKELKILISTGPFLVLFIVGIFSLSFVAMRNGITMHYFKYFLNDEASAKWFLVGGSICNLIGAGATNWLTRYWDKKNVYIVLAFINAIMMGSIYLIGANNLPLLYVIHFASSLLSGPTIPIVFAMYADIVDYQEANKGVRTSGLVFAGASFSQKMGWTVGGAATGFLLAFFGYEPNVEQSESAITGIQWMFTLVPGALAVFGALAMYWYRLDEKAMNDIQSALDVRKAEST